MNDNLDKIKFFQNGDLDNLWIILNYFVFFHIFSIVFHFLRILLFQRENPIFHFSAGPTNTNNTSKCANKSTNYFL